MISRHIIVSSAVAVEYAITPLGKTLKTHFTMLIAWANQYGPDNDD
ncbi:winged helix-turn-helix transcriptional regulator [Sodalis sp.]